MRKKNTLKGIRIIKFLLISCNNYIVQQKEEEEEENRAKLMCRYNF